MKTMRFTFLNWVAKSLQHAGGEWKGPFLKGMESLHGITYFVQCPFFSRGTHCYYSIQHRSQSKTKELFC